MVHMIKVPVHRHEKYFARLSNKILMPFVAEEWYRVYIKEYFIHNVIKTYILCPASSWELVPFVGNRNENQTAAPSRESLSFMGLLKENQMPALSCKSPVVMGCREHK